MGLFERWLEIERATGRSLVDILRDLNDACGTAYRSNYPTVMASRGFTLDRLPTNVRRYMLAKVLPEEFKAHGVELSDEGLARLVLVLT